MHVDPETGRRAEDTRSGYDAPPSPSDWRVSPEIRAPYAQSASGDAVTLRAGEAAPDRVADMRLHADAAIRVRVRALQGAELGLLERAADDPAALERLKTQAMSRKQEEDLHGFGLDAGRARDPQQNPYYASPAHIAWSEAAQLRCDGRLDARWLRDFDPYGGALSQGALLFPGGDYPHALSKIAFAHRADWNLGRFFDAGPLRGLYDSGVPQPQLGFYGLSALCPVEPPLERLYGVGGHPDWQIDYLAQTRIREPGPLLETPSLQTTAPETPSSGSAAAFGHATAWAGGAQALAEEAPPPRAERFAALVRDLAAAGVEPGRRDDCAAALLDAMTAAGLDPDLSADRPIGVVRGTRDNVIATLGEGEAAARVAVDIASAEGAFARWSRHAASSETPEPPSPPLAQADTALRPSPPSPSIG